MIISSILDCIIMIYHVILLGTCNCLNVVLDLCIHLFVYCSWDNYINDKGYINDKDYIRVGATAVLPLKYFYNTGLV